MSNKEHTGFVVAKKEFSSKSQSFKSIIKFLWHNPGFTYLFVKGLLIADDGLIILSGLCIGVGFGGISMYGFFPILDENNKNEGLTFYLYFCFLQGIILPILFAYAVVEGLRIEGIISVTIFAIELLRIAFWSKKSKQYD